MREARVERAVTLAKVAEITKIPVETVRAIEEDAVGDLPPLPILKGFLRSYAEYVGLSPEETILRYTVFRQSVSASPPGDTEERTAPLVRIREALSRLKGLLTGNGDDQVF